MQPFCPIQRRSLRIAGAEDGERNYIQKSPTEDESDVFNLVLDCSIIKRYVAEFISELFNVGIFPATMLRKECIEKLINQPIHETI